MKWIISGVVALWLGTSGGCKGAVDANDPQSAASTPKLRANTTICEIASHFERFIGKRVVVDGCIQSDGQEYTGTFTGVFSGRDMLHARVLEIDDDTQNVRIVPASTVGSRRGELP